MHYLEVTSQWHGFQNHRLLVFGIFMSPLVVFVVALLLTDVSEEGLERNEGLEQTSKEGGGGGGK